jgi:hypothetical protein
MKKESEGIWQINSMQNERYSDLELKKRNISSERMASKCVALGVA